MKTFEEYVERQIKEGYFSESGMPLKCQHCNSESLDEYNSFDEGFGRVEYWVRCENCKKHIGVWAYGNWNIEYK